MQKKPLTIIFIIVFIDLLGFSLILPLLPFYAESYQAGPFVISLLVASYAAMQFIGGPLLGRLSDKYGRRPVLLLSIFGTFLGFLLLAFAEPIGIAITNILPAGLVGQEPSQTQNVIILSLLFLSRMIDGLTGGNISVAQAYIADITTTENRAKGMGLIGAAFGLGFIIGPAIGGGLSRWGYALPALVAAGISFINVIAVYLWLPESLSEERRKAMAANPRPVFSVKDMWQAISRPRVGPLLQIRFVYGVAFVMFETMFALHALYHLELNAELTGYIMGYIGILVVIVQGFAIGKLTARLSENYLTFGGAVLMAISLLAWAFVPNVWLLLIVMAPLALAAGVLNTIINSLLSKSVYPEEVGGTMGISSSVESLTRVLAPSLGGVLLAWLGTWAPGLVGSLFMVWVIVYAYQRLVLNPDPPLPARAQEPETSPAK